LEEIKKKDVHWKELRGCYEITFSFLKQKSLRWLREEIEGKLVELSYLEQAIVFPEN
jgi:hypothetical protein